MKLFLKIAGAVLLFLVVLAVGLNIYFNDERLQSAVMPQVEKAMGKEVKVNRMSLSFFKTFPHPALSIEQMFIPGESEQDTLLSMEELNLGVRIFSLLGDEVEFSEIDLLGPRIHYQVNKDSTTNLDFLLADESEQTNSEMGFLIPLLQVNDGHITYVDYVSETKVRMKNVDAWISLQIGDQLQSEAEIQVGALYASAGENTYVSGLPVGLQESSIIDLEEEHLQIQNGKLSIRDMALNLEGSLRSWGSTPVADLKFSSESGKFEEILKLLPENVTSKAAGLETRGFFTLDGSVKGELGGDKLPDLQMTVKVKDGYVKNPDLDEAIQDIQLQAELNNEQLTLNSLKATAGANTMQASGLLEKPFEDSGLFELNARGDVDLSTAGSFMSLEDFEIETMKGRLNLDVAASGNLNKPEEANFNAELKLEEGYLKYAGVSQAIEQIQIDASATPQQLNIRNMNVKAAVNRFSATGTVQNPLKPDNRRVDLETNLEFDLATLKDFYPISEDTLKMEGMLTASARLNGPADRIEQSVQSGSVNLRNGRITYYELPVPVRDLHFEGILEANRLTIVNSRLKAGNNEMEASGLIRNYLSDSRTVNLNIKGVLDLNELQEYYALSGINSLNGKATFNIKAAGKPEEFQKMNLNGKLSLSDVSARGDSLPQPVENLNAEMNLNAGLAELTRFNLKMGSSDFSVTGSMEDYMLLLADEQTGAAVPKLDGSLKSTYLNLDEFIDWEEDSDEKVLVHLPGLKSTLRVSVDKMIVTGVEMHNLKATAYTTPEEIRLEKASVDMFEGQASGAFTWTVPQPDQTYIDFTGNLDSLRAEAFFREYPVLGEKSSFHEYVTGAFSSEVIYTSGLDAYFNPNISEADMKGMFGMTRSRLQKHPVQNRIADFLKIEELKSLAIQRWKSSFTVEDGALQVKDLDLKSGDFGLQLNGSHHLVKGSIEYDARLLLPNRHKSKVAGILSQQMAEALSREDGTLVLPLKITGTQANPTIKPNQELIKPALEEYLKNKAGNTLKKLFGN